MKTNSVIIFVLLSVLLPSTAPGQSQFWLRNREVGSGIDAPVFDAQGVPLAGPNYLVELWGGQSPNSLLPAVGAYTLERVIIPFGTGGYFVDPNPGNVRGYSTVFNVGPGSLASLQVRAWDARLGATYEDAVAAGLGGYGESPVFTAAGTSPYAEPPELAAPLIGLQSFSLRPVPEPSTWALLGLGCIGLWWAVRRRR